LGEDFVLTSEQGVGQGDPEAPLFFSLGLKTLFEAIASFGPEFNVWYLDDGSVGGDVRTLAAIYDIIKVRGSRIGLKVNPEKCHLWTPVGLVEPLPSSLNEVQLHGPAEGLKVLGCPVGSSSWVHAWVEEFAEGFATMLDRLKQLSNPRAASQILRTCLGSSKVMFLLRTLPWEEGVWLASFASGALRHAWELILGCSLPDLSWDLACLSIENGGLGILDPMKTQPIAFIASFLSALSSDAASHIVDLCPGFSEALQRVSPWCPDLAKDLSRIVDSSSPTLTLDVLRHPLFASWCSQSCWGLEQRLTLVKNFESLADARTAALRTLHSGPFSNDWLHSPPASSSHFLASLSSAERHDVLRYRVGLPVMKAGFCEGCLGRRDAFGDHAMACASCGIYARHNVLRDALAGELRKAGFTVTIEEQVPHTEPPDRPPVPNPQPSLRSLRPADILVSSFRAGKPMAIDTTVVHPLRISSDASAHGVSVGSSACQAESRKVDKYLSACNHAGWLFMPFGVESTGGWGSKARRLIQVIASAQASRSGTPVGEVYKTVAATLRESVLSMVAASYGRCSSASD